MKIKGADLRAMVKELVQYVKVSPKDRHAIRQILYESTALQYYTRYAYVLDQDNLRNTQETNEHGTLGANTRIWQLWYQGIKHAPDIVNACIASVEKHLPDCERIILDEHNIDQYIDLPGYIYDKKKQGYISNVNFSDLLRACLLAENGGTWMDATVYLTSPPPRLFFQLPLFFFSRTPSSLLGYGHILGSSWYLKAEKSNALIVAARDLLLEYWKYENHCRHHYYFHLMLALAVERSATCRQCWENMPFYSNVPPHVLQLELFRTFDPARFEDIKLMSSIHKLTFYGNAEFDIEKEGTFYKLLVENNNRSDVSIIYKFLDG